MRLSKIIAGALSLWLCFSIHELGAPGKNEWVNFCLAPFSKAKGVGVPRTTANGIPWIFSPRAISPLEEARKKILFKKMHPFDSLLESLLREDSGFSEIPAGFLGERWFELKNELRDGLKVELHLDPADKSTDICRRISSVFHSARLYFPREIKLKGVKEGDLFYARMEQGILRLSFTDREMAMWGYFNTAVTPMSPRDPLVAVFKRQILEESKSREWFAASNRFVFLGNCNDNYEFLVVQNEKGAILGISYWNQKENKFYHLPVKCPLLPRYVRTLLVPFPQPGWLFLEQLDQTGAAIQHFFYRNQKVPVPTEEEIFQSSGMLLWKVNFQRPSGKAEVYGNDLLSNLLLFYLFPGLELEVAFFNRSEKRFRYEDLLRLCDLVSIGINFTEKTLELVNYIDSSVEPESGELRTHIPTDDIRTTAYYWDGKRRWQYRFKKGGEFEEDGWDLFIKKLKKIDKAWETSLASWISKLGFYHSSNFWFLGDKNQVEFVVYGFEDNYKVVDKNGKEVLILPMGSNRNIRRENGQWVIENEFGVYSFWLRGEKVQSLIQLKTCETSPFEGFEVADAHHFEKSLGHREPGFVYANPSRRFVIYDYGFAFFLYWFNSDGELLFGRDFLKKEIANLRYIAGSLRLDLKGEAENVTEILEINDAGYFKHRVTDGPRLLKILTEIALKLGRPQRASPHHSITPSFPDEMKLGFRDKVAELLDSGVTPCDITFYGIYRGTTAHLSNRPFWGDVQLAVVKIPGRTLTVDAQGNEVRNPTALFAGFFPGETSL